MTANKMQNKKTNKTNKKAKRQKKMIAAARVATGRTVARQGVQRLIPSNMLARAIALPHETAPKRFPQAGASRKTAVLKLRAESTATAYGGGKSQSFSVLIPSAVHPVWTTTQFTTANQTLYECGWNFPGTGGEIEMTYWKAYSAYAIAPGSMNDSPHPSPYFHVPSGCASTSTVTVSGFNGLTSMNVIFNYMRLWGDELQIAIPVGLSGGASTAPVPLAGLGASWARITGFIPTGGTLTGNTLSAVTTVVAPKDFPTLLPAFPMIEPVSSQVLNSETRITAASLLMTNTTPNVSKCGIIDAAVLEYRRDNVFETSTLYSAVTARNSALRYNGPGDKGCYTFCPPTLESETYSDYVFGTVTNSTPTGNPYYAVPTPAFRFDDCIRSNAIVFSGSESMVVNSGSASQTFVLLYDEHREFVTTSQLYLLDNSRIPLSEYQTAVQAVSSVVPFTENPIHWATLRNLVLRGFQFAKPFLKPLAAHAVNSAARAALTALA